MTHHLDGRGRARGAAGRTLLTWIAILALLAAVGWLLCERNAHSWYLVPDEGRVVVMKGLFLPLGRQEFRSSDPVQARVYAPLVPPTGKSPPEERAFGEQGDLDRALYDLLSAWAREDVAIGEPARLERGLGYLERAIELPGISSAQREDLAALRAESGYYEARRLLEKARAELAEAAEKLRLTAGSRSPRAADAQVLLRELGPALDAAVAAARSAGPTSPLPAPVSPPPPSPGQAASPPP
jgi:hypothetical protein